MAIGDTIDTSKLDHTRVNFNLQNLGLNALAKGQKVATLPPELKQVLGKTPLSVVSKAMNISTSDPSQIIDRTAAQKPMAHYDAGGNRVDPAADATGTGQAAAPADDSALRSFILQHNATPSDQQNVKVMTPQQLQTTYPKTIAMYSRQPAAPAHEPYGANASGAPDTSLEPYEVDMRPAAGEPAHEPYGANASGAPDTSLEPYDLGRGGTPKPGVIRGTPPAPAGVSASGGGTPKPGVITGRPTDVGGIGTSDLANPQAAAPAAIAASDTNKFGAKDLGHVLANAMDAFGVAFSAKGGNFRTTMLQKQQAQDIQTKAQQAIMKSQEVADIDKVTQLLPIEEQSDIRKAIAIGDNATAEAILTSHGVLSDKIKESVETVTAQEKARIQAIRQVYGATAGSPTNYVAGQYPGTNPGGTGNAGGLTQPPLYGPAFAKGTDDYGKNRADDAWSRFGDAIQKSKDDGEPIGIFPKSPTLMAVLGRNKLRHQKGLPPVGYEGGSDAGTGMMQLASSFLNKPSDKDKDKDSSISTPFMPSGD